MFSNSANLTGILERGEGLKISDVAHKSFIDVNEEGTEAAAASGIKYIFNSFNVTIILHF